MSETIFALIVLGTLWLAWSNGANDNFKGVATLYGCRALDYRKALAWASLATVAGSLVSVFLAQELVQTFSGMGFLPEGTLNDAMLAAVGIAAGATVLLATVLGMPTSTTHALTGALVGAGLAAQSGGVDYAVLTTKFAQPLLLSPVLAVALTLWLYPIAHRMRRRLAITRASCLCIGETTPLASLPAGATIALSSGHSAGIALHAGTLNQCAERYSGRFIGVDAHTAATGLHFLSAGAVCFARAVNDTPKIAALLLTAGLAGGRIDPAWVLIVVTAAVAAGGLIQSRKVAETLSRRITDLNAGQGLTANLVTAFLVLGASHLGLPVSTTHVATGAIFGIGAVNGTRNWNTIGQILLTWISTLPLGLILGAGLYLALDHITP